MPSPLIFNWLDLTRYPWGPENPGVQTWEVARIGNDLYALTTSSLTFSNAALYKSTDAGLTWALIDTACPIDLNGDGSQKIVFYAGKDGKLRLIVTEDSGSDDQRKIKFSQFNPTLLTWSAKSFIGGGFDQKSSNADSSSSAVLEFVRNDGSRIVVYSPNGTISDLGRVETRILKETGGTWTQLAEFGNATNAAVSLKDGYIDANDNIGIFAVQDLDTTSLNPDLVFISVSSADVVTSPVVIDAGLETNGNFLAPAGNGRCDISADGNTVAYAYLKLYATNFSSPSTVLNRVAMGNIGANALAPAWTIETAATGYAPNANPTPSVSFQGTNTPHIYYLGGTITRGADLYHSQRTGTATWSTPDLIWDHSASPAVNPPVSAGMGIDAFDLLNAFSNGVGIFISLFNSLGSAPHHVFAGYNGPSLATRADNYACAGGPFATRGNYASA